MNKNKPIFNYIALLGGVIAIIDFFLKYLRDKSQFAEIRSFILLLVLSSLIIFDLSNKTKHFIIRYIYAVPLVIFVSGASIVFQNSREIASTILGGIIACVGLFLLERTYLLVFRKQRDSGLDQGDYLAIYIAGLYVGLDRFLDLVFLFLLLAALFYAPLVILRKLKMESRVPVVAFITISAIIIATPFYENVMISYRNIGHELQVEAVHAFIAQDNKLPVNLNTSMTQITVTFKQEGLSGKQLGNLYKNNKPRLVYSCWRSLSFGKKERHVILDLNTGAVFTVKPVYYVHTYRKENKALKKDK